MIDADRPAYLVMCGTATGRNIDPEYEKRAASIATKTGLQPLAIGQVDSSQVEVLEGALPSGTTFIAIERFPSMAELKRFYFSEAYQSAIPLRADSVKMNFLAAVDGTSET